MYTVGSMFAGVGGICLGFKKSGFKLVWANEYNKKAAVTYGLNFKHSLDTRDVSDNVLPEEFSGVDVITSGFPCQAFSVAGYRQGFADEKGRGILFLHTANFIDKMKPKAFLLENVKNLAGHDGGKPLRTIKNVMQNDLGYSFIPFIKNSKDFGVPQTRERIYIVGFRDEAGFNSEGMFEGVNMNDPEEYPCSCSFKLPDGIDSKPCVRDFLFLQRQDDKYYYNKDHAYYAELNKTMRSKQTVYQWRRVYVRENKSNLCPTLTANMGTGGHNVPLIRDDYGIRKLTPEECFSMQGFYLINENYKLPETLADSHLYKQAGNSVAVPVVKAIADNLKRALDIRYL